MFREMRRKNQLLSKNDTATILETCTCGVLGVTGDYGYPYTVPLSFVFKDNKIFFHCAKEGHKIDSIKKNDKVTFCVIERDEVMQKTFTTHYRSVSVFGRARVLSNKSEIQSALESLVEKYSPDYKEEGQQEIQRALNNVCLVEIKIEHITGKACKDIIN